MLLPYTWLVAHRDRRCTWEGGGAVGRFEVVRAVGGVARDIAGERDARLDVVVLQVLEQLVAARRQHGEGEPHHRT